MRERWSEMRMQGCEESLDNSWQLGQCKIGSSGYRWKKSLYDNREISEASKIQVFFHHEWNAFLLPCAIVSSLLCPATLLSPEAGRVLVSDFCPPPAGPCACTKSGALWSCTGQVLPCSDTAPRKKDGRGSSVLTWAGWRVQAPREAGQGH